MKSSQWFVLSIMFWILMGWFIFIDSTFNCDMFSLEERSLSQADIWCVVNSEIYDPFIYLFFALGITCSICGGLELFFEFKEKKKK